ISKRMGGRRCAWSEAFVGDRRRNQAGIEGSGIGRYLGSFWATQENDCYRAQNTRRSLIGARALESRDFPKGKTCARGQIVGSKMGFAKSILRPRATGVWAPNLDGQRADFDELCEEQRLAGHLFFHFVIVRRWKKRRLGGMRT